MLNAADFVGISNRKAQNNHMMAECMLASIVESYFYVISNEHEKYTVQDVKVSSLLYKLLMTKAIVDTRATTYQFRNNLANMDNYMTSVKSNIEMFNIYVKNTIEGLKARRESVDDLMMLIFKGYKAASESKFIEYISTKEERYVDDIKGDILDWEQLMQLSLNKFTMRRDNCEWGAPTEEQSQLTALSSEIRKLKENNKQLINTLKRTKKTGKRSNPCTVNNKKWAWKKISPPTGTSSVKTVEGKKYHGCTNHQAWTLHSTEQYRNKPTNDTVEDDRTKVDTYDEAMVAVMQAIESDSDSESQE